VASAPPFFPFPFVLVFRKRMGIGQYLKVLLFPFSPSLSICPLEPHDPFSSPPPFLHSLFPLNNWLKLIFFFFFFLFLCPTPIGFHTTRPIEEKMMRVIQSTTPSLPPLFLFPLREFSGSASIVPPPSSFFSPSFRPLSPPLQ